MKNLARILVSALALWLTTLIVGGTGQRGVWIEPVNNDMLGMILTFVITAIIFAIINITVGKVFRFVALPLRILTLGLFNFVINGVLLLIVGWISGRLGFGLEVSGFWWAVLGAIVLSIITVLLNAVLGLNGEKKK